MIFTLVLIGFKHDAFYVIQTWANAQPPFWPSQPQLNDLAYLLWILHNTENVKVSVLAERRHAKMIFQQKLARNQCTLTKRSHLYLFLRFWKNLSSHPESMNNQLRNIMKALGVEFLGLNHHLLQDVTRYLYLDIVKWYHVFVFSIFNELLDSTVHRTPGRSLVSRRILYIISVLCATCLWYWIPGGELFCRG